MRMAELSTRRPACTPCARFRSGYRVVTSKTAQSVIEQLTLAPAEAERLTEFARACRAAVRAVALYPAGHPAVAHPLRRLVEMTAAVNLPNPIHIKVAVDRLLIGERAPARPDGAVSELASILHAHSIGRLTVLAG